MCGKVKSGEAASRATIAPNWSPNGSPANSKVVHQFLDEVGTECEPIARAAYEAEYGLLVTENGQWSSTRAFHMAGASPDGLVSIDGLIEIKCPETKAHIDTILSGEAPAKLHPANAMANGMHWPEPGWTS